MASEDAQAPGPGPGPGPAPAPAQAPVDATSPFYMHANENPGAVLVSSVLTGDNYHSWSRSISVALRSKNKFQFVNGALARPVANDPNFIAWDRCNTLVLSWLFHSLHPSIAQSVLWMENAFDVWNDLRERYYQGDLFRICDLQEEIYLLRQGEYSITAYYTELKTLWQELDNFRPIPPCTCTIPCSCNLITTIQRYREGDRVIRFLKGLNDSYSAVRSQIMLMDPLPTVNRVFSMLIQQERQFNIQLDESYIPSNFTDMTVSGTGTRTDIDTHTRGGRTTGDGGRINKICSYCNRNGHTIERCYKKHGYPLYIRDNETVPSFTHEQHNALLSLLRERNLGGFIEDDWN